MVRGCKHVDVKVEGNKFASVSDANGDDSMEAVEARVYDGQEILQTLRERHGTQPR